MDAKTWRVLTAVAAAVTIASATFAVGAAVSSSDDSGGTSTASGGTQPSGPAQAISIADFAFNPPTVSVAAGTTVTFTNDDDVAHSVQSEDGTLASPTLAPGDEYSVTLDQAGTIDYVCGIHDFMSGSITVSS